MTNRAKSHSVKVLYIVLMICFLSGLGFVPVYPARAGGALWSNGAAGPAGAEQKAPPPNPTQRELIHKIEKLYQEIVAATRANRLTHALDKIEVAETLLDPDILPEQYCRRFHLKIDRIKKDMRARYLRDIRTGRRQKEERMLEHLMISSLPEMSQIPLPAFSEVSSFEPSPSGPVKAQVRAPQAQPKVVRVEKPSRQDEADQVIAEPVESADVAPPVPLPEMTAAPQEAVFDPAEVPRDYQFMLDEKLDMLYEDGLAFYRQGLYDQARRILNSVNRASPGYKLTAEYLRLIDRQTGERTDQEKAVASSQISDDKRTAVIEYYLDAYD